MSQVPSIESVEYAIRTLKVVLGCIENRQQMNRGQQHHEVGMANFASAATLQGIGTGLIMAENAVLVEIETLEHRLAAVQQYWSTQQ